MDQPVLQNSTKFPPGYGDFALQSSDNVVCYFPRYLLEYMSPVFKDMFSLPEPNTSYPIGKPPNPSPLKLTENSAVIEALLEHINPKSKRGLPIQPDVILELLEAAQKYQISTITKWFVGHVGLPQIDDSSETPAFLESFTVTHPQLTLTCALRFDFPSIGRTALKELAGCPASIIQLESEDLLSRVYKHQCQLREVRIERYRQYISELSRTIKPKLGTYTRVCSVCCGCVGEWILCMERAIVNSPRWNSFLDAYQRINTCATDYCEMPDLAKLFSTQLSGWETEAKQLESRLPEWPF